MKVLGNIDILAAANNVVPLHNFQSSNNRVCSKQGDVAQGHISWNVPPNKKKRRLCAEFKALMLYLQHFDWKVLAFGYVWCECSQDESVCPWLENSPSAILCRSFFVHSCGARWGLCTVRNPYSDWPWTFDSTSVPNRCKGKHVGNPTSNPSNARQNPWRLEGIYCNARMQADVDGAHVSSMCYGASVSHRGWDAAIRTRRVLALHQVAGSRAGFIVQLLVESSVHIHVHRYQ